MNSFNDFKNMINNLNEENLSELCEQFLFDHEGAMKTLSKYCIDFGLRLDDAEIKDHMSTMHGNGDFDHIVCFGIELSENQLYKKFHPA
tara:strand:+ start:1190 stop:1456 length:267 start_codon:yes stop_codon:yes gene_type:complete